MLDNLIRGRSAQAVGPVVEATDNLFAVGNVFTVPSAILCRGRTIAFDNHVVSRNEFTAEIPALPGVAARYSRPTIDVPFGANTDAIERAIAEADAFRGKRPIVHLPWGAYIIASRKEGKRAEVIY